MKKIILNNKGQLINKDLVYFGGKYGFFERLSMGGIGSPKVIYQKGILYFDEIAFVENELSFANFELMKNGFLIRLNRNQQLRYVGFQLDEILEVRLRSAAMEAGTLSIKMKDAMTLNFQVPIQNMSKIKAFFEKKIFSGKFELI